MVPPTPAIAEQPSPTAHHASHDPAATQLLRLGKAGKTRAIIGADSMLASQNSCISLAIFQVSSLANRRSAHRIGLPLYRSHSARPEELLKEPAMNLNYKFVVATIAAAGCWAAGAAPANAFWGCFHHPRVAYSPVVVASPVTVASPVVVAPPVVAAPVVAARPIVVARPVWNSPVVVNPVVTNYAPAQYAPAQYAPAQYAPAQYAPAQYAPAPTVAYSAPTYAAAPTYSVAPATCAAPAAAVSTTVGSVPTTVASPVTSYYAPSPYAPAGYYAPPPVVAPAPIVIVPWRQF